MDEGAKNKDGNKDADEGSGGGGALASSQAEEQIEADAPPQLRITDPQQEPHTCRNEPIDNKTDMQGRVRHMYTPVRWRALSCLFTHARARLGTCTHTHACALCGLAVATADAGHEYFSQTLWQSFHLHGPDVSS